MGWGEAFPPVECSQGKSLEIEDANAGCAPDKDCVIRQNEPSHGLQSLCTLE